MRRIAAAQLVLPLWLPPEQLALPLRVRKPRVEKVRVTVPAPAKQDRGPTR